MGTCPQTILNHFGSSAHPQALIVAMLEELLAGTFLLGRLRRDIYDIWQV